MSSGNTQTHTPVFTRMPDGYQTTRTISTTSSSDCKWVFGKPVFFPMPIDEKAGSVDSPTQLEHNNSDVVVTNVEPEEDHTESRPLRLFRLDELLPAAECESLLNVNTSSDNFDDNDDTHCSATDQTPSLILEPGIEDQELTSDSDWLFSDDCDEGEDCEGNVMEFNYFSSDDSLFMESEEEEEEEEEEKEEDFRSRSVPHQRRFNEDFEPQIIPRKRRFDEEG